jgi:hypothetical protein
MSAVVTWQAANKIPPFLMGEQAVLTEQEDEGETRTGREVGRHFPAAPRHRNTVIPGSESIGRVRGEHRI